MCGFNRLQPNPLCISESYDYSTIDPMRELREFGQINGAIVLKFLPFPYLEIAQLWIFYCTPAILSVY